MKTQYKTVQDIFNEIGPSSKVATILNMHQFSVDRWHRIGIAEKHWSKLMEVCDVTPIELHLINEKLRKKKSS